MKLNRELARFVLVQMVLVVSVSIIVSSGMKVIFEVPRICEGLESCPESFSFPSRHTTGAFSIATIFMFYTRNIFYKTFAFVAAALVGYYRIFIGVHTTIDVFVGAIVGIAISIGFYYLIKRRKKYAKFFK